MAELESYIQAFQLPHYKAVSDTIYAEVVLFVDKQTAVSLEEQSGWPSESGLGS
jgi:galactokinase/mevalonate kinase-like predicted kinase